MRSNLPDADGAPGSPNQYGIPETSIDPRVKHHWGVISPQAFSRPRTGVMKQ